MLAAGEMDFCREMDTTVLQRLAHIVGIVDENTGEAADTEASTR